MKKLLLTISLFLIFIPSNVYAHGGPPFTSINGEKTLTNPIFSGSALFKITYEIAPHDYLVGQSLSFSLDTNLLPVDQSQLTQTTFIWDFGDGSQKTSMNTSHTYTKIGSFTVSLKVTDPSTTEPVEIESIKVNILPNASYSLPQATVSANGKIITDALKNPVLVGKSEQITLDGKNSKGKIKTYEWDLGDGTKLTTGEAVKHTFTFTGDYAYSFFPILKVTDQNGFMSETTIQITNKDALGNDDQKPTKVSGSKKSSSPQNLLIYILIAGGIILVGGGLFLLRKKS